MGERRQTHQAGCPRHGCDGDKHKHRAAEEDQKPEKPGAGGQLHYLSSWPNKAGTQPTRKRAEAVSRRYVASLATVDLRNDSDLIDAFVATFERLDDLWTSYELDPNAWQLVFGSLNEYGCKQWRPIRVATEQSALDELYASLPARFPPLYERLVLSYRWAEVDLGPFRLLANPPGPNLDGLSEEFSRHKAMQEILFPNKCLQFGKGTDLNYDAICFDWSRRLQDGDCPIVQVDHEEILSHYRFKKVAEVASSFRELMLRVVTKATT